MSAAVRSGKPDHKMVFASVNASWLLKPMLSSMSVVRKARVRNGGLISMDSR